MPRWAAVTITALLVLGVAAIVLGGITFFSLISRTGGQQQEICRLYLLLHRDQIAAVIPPGCLP